MGWRNRKIFLAAQQKMESDDLAGAEEIFSQIIAKDSKHAEALLHRAYIRARLKKLDEAAIDATNGIALRPEGAVFHMVYGEILLKQGQFDQAYSALKKAIALESDNGRALFHLGEVCLKLGKKDEAADYFEVALSFERDYVLSHWIAAAL